MFPFLAASNPAGFLANLRYMGLGMLVIFLIMGTLVLSTVLINFLFSDPVEK